MESEMKKLDLKYDDIISVECLLSAWREFVAGKRRQNDVADFEMHLMRNFFELHDDLKSRRYRHGPYEAFSVSDPKPRSIHKASVRDRIVHRLLYRALKEYFDKRFIFDSYSCREDKGVLRAINRFRVFARKVSRNNTRTCLILKCDIRKFFASIDHAVLLGILERHIGDRDMLKLVGEVIRSFETDGQKSVGLPLGNLTSQLFSNIYLNELDRHMKRCLKLRRYIRYADDFVILSDDRQLLENLIPEISVFLTKELRLSLHSGKIFLKTWTAGMDFLGWTHFPHCRTLRTATKKKMFRNLRKNKEDKVVAAYYGLLSHGNTYTLKKEFPLSD
ncbi:MAG: reverse transcriptase domain-containing protein [Patescibacteria group bacterium]